MLDVYTDRIARELSSPATSPLRTLLDRLEEARTSLMKIFTARVAVLISNIKIVSDSIINYIKVISVELTVLPRCEIKSLLSSGSAGKISPFLFFFPSKAFSSLFLSFGFRFFMVEKAALTRALARFDSFAIIDRRAAALPYEMHSKK